MASLKELYATVTGFLNHHVNDLDAVSAALQGLLAAVPVNAETRASINEAIDKVTTSAKNVATSLEQMGALQTPEFHIAESDIVKALDDSDMKAIISQMIADYLAAHPQVGPVVPQQDASAATTAVKGAIMQDSDRSGAQQMGETDTVQTVPQDGTNQEQDAPAGDAGNAASGATA